MLHPLKGLVGALVAAALLSACGKQEAPPPPPVVHVSKPLLRQIVDWDEYVGRFEATDTVEVRPRVSGYLIWIGFKDGQMVQKGQALYVIDPRPYQAALDQARAQAERAEAALANAKSQRKRGETLLAARAISQQEFDTLSAAEKQAAADAAAGQAAVRTNALNLAFTRVIAPFAGRISDSRIREGNLVSADQTVLTNIVSLDPIYFTFEGSEGVYLKYQRQNEDGTRRSSRLAANPVLIKLQDESDYRWRGRMDFVDNALDVNSGTIRGRAVVANPDHFLTPGMFGRLRLLGSGAYQAMLIPDSAIIADQSRQIVYIVGEDGIVGQRVVTLGPLFDGLRVIRGGLDAQDDVVIDGMQRARVGQKVQPTVASITPPRPGVSPRPADIEALEAPSASLAESVP